MGEVLTCCPLLRAIWRVGRAANGNAGLSSSFTWDLIAFGDAAALQVLRQASHLHRQNVRIRVVTDGDHFRSAWGIEQDGSLARWEWGPTIGGEAFYSDIPALADHRSRARYRAVRLWQAVAGAPLH